MIWPKAHLLTDKELLNQFNRIEKMPEEKKSVVKIFLDAFITKDKINNGHYKNKTQSLTGF
jgi:hypothetical protein